MTTTVTIQIIVLEAQKIHDLRVYVKFVYSERMLHRALQA